MFAKHYNNPTMLSRVTAKMSGMFFETKFAAWSFCTKNVGATGEREQTGLK